MSGLLTPVTSAAQSGDNDAGRSRQHFRSPRRKTDGGPSRCRTAATATYERHRSLMTADTQARPSAPTTHQGILDFVTEVAELTTPDRIHWCTGSDEEWTELT